MCDFIRSAWRRSQYANSNGNLINHMSILLKTDKSNAQLRERILNFYSLRLSSCKCRVSLFVFRTISTYLGLIYQFPATAVGSRNQFKLTNVSLMSIAAVFKISDGQIADNNRYKQRSVRKSITRPFCHLLPLDRGLKAISGTIRQPVLGFDLAHNETIDVETRNT